MNQPKVSVIIAVYNAEKTLPRCLDSLAGQTLRELEFVCVDDGSTDGSAAILDAYAAKDPRFAVYHKSNEGVSATRQFGLGHVHGEYVIHLDADDFAERDAYQRLYEASFDAESDERADIVICDALRITADGVSTMDFADEDLSAAHLLERMFSWETSALWNRLIRTELIARYRLHFPPGVNLAEDRYFLACLLNRSIREQDLLRIRHLGKALIHYDNTANKDSLTNRAGPGRASFADTARSCQVLIDELDMDRFGNAFYAFVSTLAFQAFWSARQTGIDSEAYSAMFGPFQSGIRRYVPRSLRRQLVGCALERGIESADRFRFLLYPGIVFDKLSAAIRRRK